VYPTLAARHPLEVLHGIRDVHIAPHDVRSLERLIKHAAGRAHERQAGQVLLVARLLADQQ
jgi:hypothetical protein